MAEPNKQELHCPFCQTGLGITEALNLETAIECPGCSQLFYPESATDKSSGRETNQAAGDLDGDAKSQGRSNLPEPKPRPTKLPAKSGDIKSGWSKWEHAAQIS